MYVLCSLCGQDSTVLDVCDDCKLIIQRTITRHNFRARQKGVPSTLTSPQWIKILQLSQGYCHYCEEYEGGAIYLTLDHVIPIAKGGANSPENIVAACGFCNRGKNARSAEQWLKELQNVHFCTPGIRFTRHGIKRVEGGK